MMKNLIDDLRLKELSLEEKNNISGGGDPIYDVFYAIGSGARWLWEELKSYEPGELSYTNAKVGKPW
jgi:hypothetical protein